MDNSVTNIFAEVKKQAYLDQAMLQSMAASFRGRLDFSFSPDDMAELLDRLREDHIDQLCT